MEDQVFEEYLDQLAQQPDDLLRQVEPLWQGARWGLSGGHSTTSDCDIGVLAGHPLAMSLHAHWLYERWMHETTGTLPVSFFPCSLTCSEVPILLGV